MTITSSTFAVGPAQADGRVFITETHLDSFAGALTFSYLGTADNANVVMAARVAQIVEMLEVNEAVDLIDNNAPFALQQNTAAQFAARMRARYLGATQVECARLATWILDHIAAGNFTATQVQNAFGLTSAQWTTLQTKMTNLRTAYQAVLAAVGE